MNEIAILVQELIAAGTPPEIAASCIAQAVSIGAMSGGNRVDKTTLKRREWDRNYRARKRGIPPESTRFPPVPPDTSLSIEEDKKEKKERQRATRIPPDWRPTSSEEEFATQQGLPSAELARETEKFRDYWQAKPGAGGCKLDWPATWRNWIRRVCEQRGYAPTAATGPPRKYQPPPGAPTREELEAKYAAIRREDEGIAAESTEILDSGVGISAEEQIGVDLDRAAHGPIRGMGELFSEAGLDTIRTSTKRPNGHAG